MADTSLQYLMQASKSFKANIIDLLECSAPMLKAGTMMMKAQPRMMKAAH